MTKDQVRREKEPSVFEDLKKWRPGNMHKDHFKMKILIYKIHWEKHTLGIFVPQIKGQETQKGKKSTSSADDVTFFSKQASKQR
jgi:hypothetical protein